MDIVESMNDTLNELKQGFYRNNDSVIPSCPKNAGIACSCWMALNKWNGYVGPYCNISYDNHL